jgi:hypothetical protein
MLKEPVLVIVGGGVTLVQAVMHLLKVFNVWNVTPEQEAAVTSVAGIVLAALARSQVTPNAQIPANVTVKSGG